MSLVEALIIYLSAGAPFGVLVFFSQKNSRAASVVYSLLATIAWPIFGGYRVYRSLYRRRISNSNVVSAFESQADVIRLLERLSVEVPTKDAELFAIAGHPNPWLATNCYVRSRKKVIDSHRERHSREVFESSSPSVSGSSTSQRKSDLQPANSLVT